MMRLMRSRLSPRVVEEQSIIAQSKAASLRVRLRGRSRTVPPPATGFGNVFRGVDLGTAAYIPPRRRHIIHSVISRAASSRKFTGMSHNSRVWGTEAWDST